MTKTDKREFAKAIAGASAFPRWSAITLACLSRIVARPADKQACEHAIDRLGLGWFVCRVNGVLVESLASVQAANYWADQRNS